MERSDVGSSYEAYLRQLDDEISDLDLASREEILKEVSAHLEDADEALSGSFANLELRTNRVLSQSGSARTLARQLGEVHAGPTGLVQRIVAPCLLAALAAGHFATALALRTAYTDERATEVWAFDMIYTHLYLLLAGLAFFLAIRQLFLVLRHPFRATDFQLFLPLFPLALLLAMVLAGFSDEGQPVAYRVEQFWYWGFVDPHLYATGSIPPYAEPRFFEAGVALAALSVLGVVPALLLRQPRWLLIWGAVHGTLLAGDLLVPFMLGAVWAWPHNSGLLPILVLPWLYAAAAWHLGLPLRQLGRKPLLVWGVSALAGVGLVLHAHFFPGSSMTVLVMFAWYWPATISLPVYAKRLWPYADPERRVSDPLAVLSLVPATLVLGLLIVQTDWATPEIWRTKIAMWENGELLWGAAQWLFVVALAVWALLLLAAVPGRGFRTRQIYRARFFVIVAIVLGLIVSYGAPHARAQVGPGVAVQPATAAPGETVTITGTGWPAGTQLTARLYTRGSGPSGPLADLKSPFETDESGSFSFQATVPMALLRLDDSSYRLYLAPGQYNLLVQSEQGLSYSTPFAAVAPRQGSLLWGETGYDVNPDGRFDVYRGDTRAGPGVAINLTPVDGGTPRQVITDAVGRYMFTPIPAGSYTLRADSQFQGASWAASATVSTSEAQVTKIDLALAPGTAGGTPPKVEAPSPEQAAPQFRLGFATLASLIPNIVGQPLENEHYGANGDSLQQTTTGLMVWRKADNWTAFTDGYTTWVNGPEGLQVRLNTERFGWEGGSR